MISLKVQNQQNRSKEIERKNAIRYHKVKFFEQQKLSRMERKLTRQLRIRQILEMISTESQHNENQHALVLEDNEYKTKTRDDVVENLKKLSSQLAGLKHEKTLLEESLEQSMQRVVDLESQVTALTNKHQDYLL